MSAVLLLAALALVVLTAVTLRPRTVTTQQLAPGSEPRVQGRDPSGRRTMRRGAERRTARPAARRTSKPTPAPDAVIERYYRALDAGRYEDAWTVLTPAVRASFGRFEDWRAGYATTLSNSPRDIEVASEGAAVAVAHELVTEDRSSCGPVERSFAVRWKLVATADGWRAAALTAEKRAGPDPGEACDARHDAARVTGGQPAS